MYWYSKSLDKAFAVKANALLAADDIEFRLDDKYDSYDWMEEPTRSWDQIITDRCIQLRDENQYLRLWYSGGEDSHTILKCFIENKIPIDEIAMMRCSFTDPNKCPSAKEINEYCVPFLNNNREELLGAKIQFYDIGPDDYAAYMETFSLLTSNQIDFRYSCFNKYEETVFPHMNDIPGIKNIFGVDKPLVNHDDQGFYWYQNDAVLMNYLSLTDNTPNVVTNFYLDFLDVQHKQVYMAIDSYLDGSYDPGSVTSMTARLNSRKQLTEGRVLRKATATGRSDKLITTVRECLRNPDTRHIYRSYLKAINGTGLDKSHFNRENPIFFYKGIQTKKYRVL